MDYEDILLNLTRMSVLPQSPLPEYFDSALISKIFRNLEPRYALPVPLSRRYPPEAFGVKRISGDLDKLFRMGLLKRKRVNRLFKSRDGTRMFGRGYKYMYKISPQGWNYSLYLADNRGVTRDERKKKRRTGFWPEDEVAIKIIGRSNVSEVAAVEIAEQRKKQFPAEEGVHKRFPVQFDEEQYGRYLIERMDNVKTKTNLRKSKSEAEKAEREALKYKTELELRNRETPLLLLLKAKNMAEKENIDPEIYPQGVRELAVLGIKSEDVSGVRLSKLLGWIIKEMANMGYILSK